MTTLHKDLEQVIRKYKSEIETRFNITINDPAEVTAICWQVMGFVLRGIGLNQGSCCRRCAAHKGHPVEDAGLLSDGVNGRGSCGAGSRVYG